MRRQQRIFSAAGPSTPATLLRWDDSARSLRLDAASRTTVHRLGPGTLADVGGSGGWGFGRLSVPEAGSQELDILAYSSGANRILWRRNGPLPELQLPPEVYFSLAGSAYSLLGTMQRVAGGWIDRGFVAPLSQTFFLRTQGLIGSASSGGVVERAQQFLLDHEEGIFADSFE